jgi:hypothetical protein
MKLIGGMYIWERHCQESVQFGLHSIRVHDEYEKPGFYKNLPGLTPV